MGKRLTKAEEEVMLIIWRLKEVIVRDIMRELNDPEIPYTTVSTVVRILEKKGFVRHRAVGTTHLYYPLISQKTYLKGFLTNVVSNYFNGSFSNLAAFFAKETNVSLKELKEMMDEVEGDLNKEEDSHE